MSGLLAYGQRALCELHVTTPRSFSRMVNRVCAQASDYGRRNHNLGRLRISARMVWAKPKHAQH